MKGLSHTSQGHMLGWVGSTGFFVIGPWGPAALLSPPQIATTSKTSEVLLSKFSLGSKCFSCVLEGSSFQARRKMWLVAWCQRSTSVLTPGSQSYPGASTTTWWERANLWKESLSVPESATPQKSPAHQRCGDRSKPMPHVVKRTIFESWAYHLASSRDLRLNHAVCLHHLIYKVPIYDV